MNAKPDDPFAVRFCKRTQAVREEMDWTQKQMADALGIELERYKKYEARSPLPHRFLKRFALISGVSVDDLLNLDAPVGRLPVRKAPNRSGAQKH